MYRRVGRARFSRVLRVRAMVDATRKRTSISRRATAAASGTAVPPDVSLDRTPLDRTPLEPRHPTQLHAQRLDDLLRAARRHAQQAGAGVESCASGSSRRGGSRLVSREFAAGGDGHRDLRIGRGQGLAGWAMTTGAAAAPRRRRRAAGVERSRCREFRVGAGRAAVPARRRRSAAIECLDTRDGGDFTDADFDRLEVAPRSTSRSRSTTRCCYEETERRALEKEVLLEISRTLCRRRSSWTRSSRPSCARCARWSTTTPRRSTW